MIVVLVCGIPGAGKTTLSQQLQRELERQQRRVVCVCVDDYVPSATCGVDRWRRGRDRAMEDLHERMAAYAGTPTVLLVDDNLYLQSMRRRLFQGARDLSAAFCTLWVGCSLQTAIARNRQRVAQARVDEQVIVSMAERMEPPKTTIGWESFSAILTSETPIDVHDALRVILKAEENPFEPFEENKSVPAVQSEAHVIDVATRKELKRHLDHMTQHARKQYAAILNQERRRLMEKKLLVNVSHLFQLFCTRRCPSCSEGKTSV